MDNEMIWGNPPPLKINPPKKGKKITPEQLAASGTEDGNQAALFCWAADNVDNYPPLKWLHAIPNGGQRHIAEATKLVATGTRSGVLDTFLPWPVRLHQQTYDIWEKVYCGCYIEMKKEKYRNSRDGGCTKEQLEFIAYASSAGYYCKVCYTWEEARDCLINYLEGRL